MSAARPAVPPPAEPAEPVDPYGLDPRDVREPPRSIAEALRRIGPGMVLAASIVGSGELIATTTLGAQIGYAGLWLVLLSCLIKPVVQGELGRYTIASGRTGLEALDLVPGPRWRVSWIVWAWAVMVLITMLQVGGMYGGVSQVMHILVPAVPVRVWVFAFLALTLALLLGGGYQRIERLAFVKVGLFTMLTVLAAAVLVRMPQYFSWSRLRGGPAPGASRRGHRDRDRRLRHHRRRRVRAVHVPVLVRREGIRALRRACRRERRVAVGARAGWIRVMHVDILASMAIYTGATAAFFLLGAGVLHGMGLVPAARDMIPVLSNIYTQTLGPWALWLFYAGAIATLYGTIFASTAAQTRMFADMCRLLGLFARDDVRRRRAYFRGFVVLLTFLPVTLYLTLQSPVAMVVAGGIAQASMLPALAFAALVLRHRHLPPEVAPSRGTTALLWVAAFVIAGMIAWSGVLALFRG